MDRKKTVLFYVPFLGLGGVAVALINLIRGLEESGFECKVMLPYSYTVDVPYQFDVVPRKYFVAAAHKKPIRCTALRRIIKLLNIITGWRFYFAGVPKVRHDIFVVYQVMGEEHWSRYSNKPSFGWLHGLVRGKHGLRGLITRWDIRKSLDKFTKLIAVSNHVATNWNEFYQTRRMPQIYLNIFNVNQMIKEGAAVQVDIKPSERKQLIFLGRIFPEKGLFRLLICLHKLVSGYNIEFDLWVIGIGKVSEEKRVRDYAKAANLSDKVHFLGYKSNPYPYLRAADLLVVPSYEEGFGLVIWESLLQRCSVMATDAGGCAQALNNGKWGMLVKNDDSAIYEGLRQFFLGETAGWQHEDFDAIVNSIKEINEENKKAIVEEFRRAVVYINGH